MIAPALLVIILFSYFPMSGLLLAFKHYRFRTESVFGDMPILRFLGQIMNMEWVGVKWFENLFSKPDFWRALRNTISISVCRLIFEFPMPIILAILMNEVRVSRVKRIYQTVYTFPHFLSWVLVASVLQQILNTDGTLNGLRVLIGLEPYKYMLEPSTIRYVIHSTSIWKGIGWGSIIYMATISGIDPTLYESAVVDGANRWDRIRFITFPSIKPTIVLMLILNCGSILNAGFDQIFNIMKDPTRSSLDIFDTFIYRYAFQQNQNFSLTIAAGMFKSVSNFILLLSANQISKWLGEEGLI
ncbi:MAG: ABC transporter permease subunit [Oscillospiraceae bacterium]|nr:ABC transporter permease subunit [Oscillospiraceae bacterium]